MREAGDDLQSSQSEVDHIVLPAGRKIGRFEVVSVLGQGSFGITYRARDLQLGRDVAIKEYMPAALAIRGDGTTVRPRSTATAEDFRWGLDRFVEEGRTIANLHDAPGVVRVFEFLEANGTAYIVMELVRGETLDACLRRDGVLDAAAVERILAPLLNGLEQVHEAGFLHRDIKPGNILLDGRGNPTLIDFGASRAAMATRTVAMTAIFTPGYAAVEQFTSSKQGPWTDIYGVAATLYHVIVGGAPPSSIDRMIDDTCEPLVKLAPAGFPPALLAGIDAGLAVRVADRPQSIAAWRNMLSGAALASAAMKGPEVVAPSPPATSRAAGRRALWIGGAVVVGLLLVGGGYLAFGPAVLPAAGTASGDPPRAGQEVPRQAAAPPDQQLRPAEVAQREADPVPAAPQRTEADEAQRKADAEAAERARIQQEAAEAREALARTEAARQQAEAARQQAEAEAARLKSEAAARQTADAEAAQRREAEEEARREAAAEAAAKAKADAEVTARQQSEEERRKAGEAAETALRLSLTDRQRLQAALTALGFDTRSTDGAFGPRSRAMIAAWQRRQNQPETGYLTAAQQRALLREAAPAVAKHDEEQKRAEEAKRKAEEEAKTRATQQPAPAPTATAAAQVPVAGPPPAGNVGGLPNGTYRGNLSITMLTAAGFVFQVVVTINNGRGTGIASNDRCGSMEVNLTVDPSGVATGDVRSPSVAACGTLVARATGRASGGRLILDVSSTTTSARGAVTLTRIGD